VAIGTWRATYTPGRWIVLSGPTSMVVLQPAPARASQLLNSMWDVVLSSASIDQLAAELAAYNVERMPSFAAFFWGPAGLRSLVRGAVRIQDLTTGEYVADGDGIQTWSEIGLGDLRQVRIDMEGTPEESLEKLQLPLVVGAVTASAVVLDATEEAVVASPQATTARVDAVHGDSSTNQAPVEIVPDAEAEGEAVDEPETPALAAAQDVPQPDEPSEPEPEPEQPAAEPESSEPESSESEPEVTVDEPDDDAAADDSAGGSGGYQPARAVASGSEEPSPSPFGAPPLPAAGAAIAGAGAAAAGMAAGAGAAAGAAAGTGGFPFGPPPTMPSAPEPPGNPQPSSQGGPEPQPQQPVNPFGAPSAPPVDPAGPPMGQNPPAQGAPPSGPWGQPPMPQPGQSQPAQSQPAQSQPGQAPANPFGPPPEAQPPGHPPQPPFGQGPGQGPFGQPPAPHGQPAGAPANPFAPPAGPPGPGGPGQPPGQFGQPGQPPAQFGPPGPQGGQPAPQQSGPWGPPPGQAPHGQPSAPYGQPSAPPAPMATEPERPMPANLPEEEVDHDGATVFATGLARALKPTEQASGSDLVLAAMCNLQHPNEPGSQICSRCGGQIPPQSPRLVTRPALAILRTSQGERVELDRTVLIGRSPTATRVPREQLPRMLTVPSPSHDISRTHVEVTPDGWKVYVKDLYSTNGTTVVRPGTEVERERLVPGEPVELRIGWIIDLGDGVTVTLDPPA